MRSRLAALHCKERMENQARLGRMINQARLAALLMINRLFSAARKQEPIYNREKEPRLVSSMIIK